MVSGARRGAESVPAPLLQEVVANAMAASMVHDSRTLTPLLSMGCGSDAIFFPNSSPYPKGAMSASNEWSEYHLTPNGWVEGSEKLDFSRTERPAPADRVLTVRQHDYLSSSFSKLDQCRPSNGNTRMRPRSLR